MITLRKTALNVLQYRAMSTRKCQLSELYSSSATLPTLHRPELPEIISIVRAFMTSRRSLFRPCIDLHDGHVKQIVGGTLSETDPGSLKTNFVAKYAAPRHPIQLTWYEEKHLETLRGCINYTDWKGDI
jgi:hypothetical protein